MDFVLHNIRLKELVAIVQENRKFFEEFIRFLQAQGYASVLAFIQEPSDERATVVITSYLHFHSEAKLYDGLLRPYENSKAKWFFLAWLLRDAATQRLQPLLKSMPGITDVTRKAYLLNELRKFVEPLFPEEESWEWHAFAEVMLTRLEGSRRALKGTLFEELVRQSLRELIDVHHLPLIVGQKEVRINDETYDVQVSSPTSSILIPVKTRETMGGGHALLFTRDIYKSIWVATQHGYQCIPIIIAESWSGNLAALNSELFIYIQANPNQIADIKSLLQQKLHLLLPLLEEIAKS